MTQASDPTPAEIGVARWWLAKRGVHVRRPTRLLSIRLGTRYDVRRLRLGYFVLLAPPALLGALGYEFLPYLRGTDTIGSVTLCFLYMAVQLATWLTLRRRDRKALERLSLSATPLTRRPWWQVLGGWTIASIVTTFLGGVALSVAIHAWAWLGLLVLSAMTTTITLWAVLRAPVIAEDDGSLAVDELVRTENVDWAFPARFAFPVLADLAYGNRQLGRFAWLLVGYAVLSFGLQMVGLAVHRRAQLPLLVGEGAA